MMTEEEFVDGVLVAYIQAVGEKFGSSDAAARGVLAVRTRLHLDIAKRRLDERALVRFGPWERDPQRGSEVFSRRVVVGRDVVLFDRGVDAIRSLDRGRPSMDQGILLDYPNAFVDLPEDQRAAALPGKEVES